MPTINKMRCVSLRSTHTFFAYPPTIIFFPGQWTGIITIPGMMMHAILDGTDVEQAARLQMIIMFMISESNALS